MDVLDKVVLGFSVALAPNNLLYCFIGTVFGTLVGVLPGFGPVGAFSVLLPLTYKMEPASAIIMLAGVYYGAMYGGSTTSILVNIPGESASIVTCLDGYQMARQGRAGPALGIAAFGSFIGGTVGIVGLMFLAPVLGQAALSFGPPEFFGLTFLGLTLVSYLSRGSVTKALIMAILGLLAGSVGMDPISGAPRFTYGSTTLMDGVGLVPVAIGMFGVAEVLENIASTSAVSIFKTKLQGLLPSLKDWKDSIWAIVRGAVLGFFLGMIPGPSGTIGSFASYAIEKKLSRHPEKFGTGVIEGVAGPETANNAATTGAFVPLLSLGIPISGTTAILLGVLMIHSVQPGPLFISRYPEIFWGVVTSMYVGNVMLLVLNLPLIGMWVKVLKIPYALLFPFIFLFCLFGVYMLNNNLTEVFIMLIFGILGYLMRKGGFEGAPFLMALVLGPVMESSLRRSLLISKGSPAIFFTRPISAIFVVLGLACLITTLIPMFQRIREYLTNKVAEGN
jgi:putative tricarboxylic transport membrane protein